MRPNLPEPQTECVAVVQRLFIQHISAIKGFILGLMPDFGSADDVLQDVFLVVTKRAATYDTELSFLAWVRGIARNKVFERRRTKKLGFPTLSLEVLDSLCAIAPDDTSAELTAAASLALKECLEKLAPQARRAVDLRYGESRRPAEIAEQLGWRVGSVSVTLSRSLSLLHDCVRRKLLRQGGRRHV